MKTFRTKFLFITLILIFIAATTLMIDNLCKGHLIVKILSSPDCEYIVRPPFHLVKSKNGGYAVATDDISGLSYFGGDIEYRRWYYADISDPTIFSDSCEAKGFIKYNQQCDSIKASKVFSAVDASQAQPTDSCCDYPMPKDWYVVKIQGKYAIKISNTYSTYYLNAQGPNWRCDPTEHLPALFATECQAKCLSKKYEDSEFTPKFTEDKN